MLAARTDQKVLGYLGRALSMELSAVQQYSAQARLAATWGLAEAAETFRKEAHEELQHAERIIERMLASGAAPGASQLRPVRLGTDLTMLLEVDQALETEVIELYQAASEYCASTGDHDGRMFFEGLLREEHQHHAELGEWLGRLQGRPQQRLAGGR